MSKAVAFACAVFCLILGSCSKPAPPKVPTIPGAAVRLGDEAAPVSYAISLTPDLARMAFSGSAAIVVDVRRATRTLTLNALDLAVERASVDAGQAARIATDQAAQTVTFTFDAPIGTGRHVLAVSWRGRIYATAAGLFAVDYDTPQGKRRMLATQLESAAARQVFPGWDQPDRKATFQLTVTAPAGEMAVSNMPVASAVALPGGLQRVAFRATPKMSSYLVFLAVGDLERISRNVDGVDVGVVARRGSMAKAHDALDRAAELLRYYNAYFAIPYPLPKLDLVAVPGASSIGAMENWGAIMLFENRVLVDPRLATENDREAVAVYIAHEMAHQWFGDLVTMAWWDDLWLNESFAEWMEAKSLDHLHPDWRIWLWEASGREAAMRLDASEATHAIVQPAETMDQVNANGDAITYDKGSAVIRMLEAYVGEDAWRDGVRAYLKAHAYGSATRADLWAAIEGGARRPVGAVARDFVEQSGLPLVNAEIMAGQAPGSGLFLTEGQLGTPASQRGWRIPVTARGADRGPLAQAMVRPGSLVYALRSASPGPLVVNPGQVGYFRTVYSPSAFAPLLARLRTLGPADQLGLVLDGWALAQAGDAPAARVLDLVDRLPADADPRVWTEVIHPLQEIDTLYRGQPGQARFRAWARRRLEKVLVRVRWAPVSAAADRFAVLRPALISALADFGDPAVLAEAARRYRRSRADPASLAGGLREAVLGIAGAQADTAGFEVLRAAAGRAGDPAEQRQDLIALSRAEDPVVAGKALALALSPEVPATFGPVMIRTVALRHPDLAWRFALDHRGELGSRLDPPQQLDFIPGLLAASSDIARAGELHAFIERTYAPGSRREAGKVEAEIRRKAEVRARRLPDIDRWLAASAG